MFDKDFDDVFSRSENNEILKKIISEIDSYNIGKDVIMNPTTKNKEVIKNLIQMRKELYAVLKNYFDKTITYSQAYTELQIIEQKIEKYTDKKVSAKKFKFYGTDKIHLDNSEYIRFIKNFDDIDKKVQKIIVSVKNDIQTKRNNPKLLRYI
ncbi:MAG: hypothetical protein PHY39_05670, partial [Endomicrobiaceae bacterium]|nr:hypothetical protein [Endomicrobiaceae bacterium]